MHRYALRAPRCTASGTREPLSGSPRKSPGRACAPGWPRIGDFRGCPARGRQRRDLAKRTNPMRRSWLCFSRLALFSLEESQSVRTNLTWEDKANLLSSRPSAQRESRDPVITALSLITGSPLSGSPRKSPGTARARGWPRIGDFRGCPARGRQRKDLAKRTKANSGEQSQLQRTNPNFGYSRSLRKRTRRGARKPE